VDLDITPQREAEERLLESERRYHDLIESSHDIVQSIDAEAHFEFVNRAWHEHLGYSPEELPELTLFDIVDEADRDHCSLLIQQIMSGKSFENVEVTFIAKDGRKFPVEGNATGRFQDGRFVGTHTFFRDISERKQAEALAAQYQQQLEQEVAARARDAGSAQRRHGARAEQPRRRGAARCDPSSGGGRTHVRWLHRPGSPRARWRRSRQARHAREACRRTRPDSGRAEPRCPQRS
jgi:PAS domain S-box-containing protein